MQSRGVSLRAVLCGAALALWIGVSLPYTNMVIKGAVLAHNHNAPAALFVFFLFVGLVHTATAAIKRGWRFSRGELATIYIMALIATVIPTIGFSEYLLPIIAGFSYYATPENAWGDLFHPFLPRWAVPQDEDAIRHFYEGLPQGMPLPWVYESTDGALVLYNGVTRATRIAKLAPGTLIQVEVIGRLPQTYASLPRIGDLLT